METEAGVCCKGTEGQCSLGLWAGFPHLCEIPASRERPGPCPLCSSLIPQGASAKAMAPLPAQTKIRESLRSGCKQAEATAPIAFTSAGSRTGFCSFPSQTGPPTVQLFLLLGLVLQMKQAKRMQCYRFASYKEMSLWKPNPN